MLLLAYAVQRSFAWAAVVHMRSVPLAIVLAAAGIGLALWGERTFAAAGTEIMPASSTNKTLVTHGPFRFTRNPMYLGLTVIALGIALYMGTLPFLVIPVLVFLLTNFGFIPFEEAKMARQHGDAYTDYRKRVRRWI
jgi:protein-S-isoprenylcysteine O-methyltransferase Ste14